ncbi:MAG: pyridoxal phosphate-dependent aminotransferase [candidate division WOR-3 bacterium]|nr:pyridoxal phosphate-dependent aminotransferase [candidate division WOR-3 bacterium]
MVQRIPEKRARNVMIDRGFDSEFGWGHIMAFCGLFSRDGDVRACVQRIRASEDSVDIKRGELYPELLRALFSLQRISGKIYGIGLSQVLPNFGSNGSIDTILTAARILEVSRIGGTGVVGARRSRRSGASLEPSPAGVMFATPTYFRNYNSAGARGFRIYKIPLDQGFEFPANRFTEEMVQSRPTVVMLVSPNNPTGLPIRDEDILTVLDHLPQGTWAVLDRTLANTRPEMPSQRLLDRYQSKDLVILHSFSKYKGLSHLRIGLALFSNERMAGFVRPFLPLGLNLEAMIKAYRILRTRGGLYPDRTVLANIRGNHRILMDFVETNKGYGVTDFSGNYCLMTLPGNLDSRIVAEVLASRGLYVMPGHDSPEPDDRQVRLHTGGNPAYIAAMCEVLGKLSPRQRGCRPGSSRGRLKTR